MGNTINLDDSLVQKPADTSATNTLTSKDSFVLCEKQNMCELSDPQTIDSVAAEEKKESEVIATDEKSNSQSIEQTSMTTNEEIISQSIEQIPIATDEISNSQSIEQTYVTTDEEQTYVTTDEEQTSVTTDEEKTNKTNNWYNIFNGKNTQITEEFINNIFESYGYNHKVINLQNFQKAMIHPSYFNINLENYEGLRFLGSTMLRYAFAKYLFTHYLNKNSKFLSTNLDKMENKFCMHFLADKLNLQPYAIIDKTLEKKNGRNQVDLTKDIFKAFIGALSLEVSENRTIDFLQLIIEKDIDVPELININVNYKGQLIEYCQKMPIRCQLQYNDVRLRKGGYRTTIINKSTKVVMGMGNGQYKKLAHQDASMNALNKLGIS